jgi:hypothetical protein
MKLKKVRAIVEDAINEASLSRFYQHYQKGEPIAFISADRGENTPQENKANYQKLKNYVQMAGFGYNKIKGGYVEENGKRVVDESSIVIYATPDREKELRKLVMSLGIRFKQSSIMFINSKGEVSWISTRDDSWIGSIGTQKRLGKFKTSNINDFFTRIGKKEFKFTSLDESDDYHPSLAERQLSGMFKKLLGKDSGTEKDFLDEWESGLENSLTPSEIEDLRKEAASMDDSKPKK